jgi:hypothetical protein
MNDLTTATVQEVIALAELAANEMETGEGRTLGEAFPIGWDSQPNVQKRRLVEYLEGLTKGEMVELVALMWLGRATETGATNFAAFVEKARGENHPLEYLASKQLAGYLRSGLRKLGGA